MKSQPRTDKRDEADEACAHSDQKTKIQPGNGERDGIKRAKQKTDRQLAADKSGNGTIHLTGKTADFLKMIAWQPAIDLLQSCDPSRAAGRTPRQA